MLSFIIFFSFFHSKGACSQCPLTKFTHRAHLMPFAGSKIPHFLTRLSCSRRRPLSIRGCLRCCFCLYCLSWVVRKHYPDSCFCCCFFLIESSSLKPVLRGHKNKYDFGPVAEAGMRAPPPIKVLSWTKECYSISCSPTQSHCLL